MNRCKRLLALMLALTMLCCLMPTVAEEPSEGSEVSEPTNPPATDPPKPTNPPATDPPKPTDPPATEAPKPTDPPTTGAPSSTDPPATEAPGEPTATPGEPTATSGEPTATPGEPTATPGEPTATPGEPTATPGEPTATAGEPTATPEGPYVLTLVPKGSYSKDGNTYVYSFSSDSVKLSFTIQTESRFDGYRATVTNGSGENVPDVVLNGSSIEATLTAAGSYTVSVTGYAGGVDKASAAVSIRLEKKDPAEPTATPDTSPSPTPSATPAPSDMPGGPNGGWNGMPGGFRGFRGGGFGKRGGSAGTGEEEDKNAIKAGKALTSLHARGTRSMLGDDCIELADLNGSTYALYLVDEEVPDVQLNDGEDYFDIAVEDDTLHLTGMCETAEWSASLYSLETLNSSGIRQIKLQNADTWDTVSTDLTLQGYYYGKLRAQGYVSKDMHLRVRTGEVWMVVDEVSYQIEADGSLVPKQ